MRKHSILFGLLLAVPFAGCSSTVTSDRIGQDNDALMASMMPGVDVSALDRTADPCDDFYEFACGNYIASLPPDTQDNVRAFSTLEDGRNSVLWQVLADIQASPASDAERKAAAYYDSCMNTTPDQTAAYTQQFANQIAAIATPADVARIVATMHRLGATAFFSFQPGPDMVSRGRHGSADAAPGGFDQGTNYTNADSRAARLSVIAQFTKYANPTITDANVQKLANNSLAIEQALASLASQSVTGEGPHPLGQNGLATATPTFDWNTYFGTLTTTIPLGDFEIDQLEFFVGLDSLLQTTGIDAMRDYLTAQWYQTTTAAIRNTSSDAHGRPGMNRDNYCSQMLTYEMSDAIETRFLQLAGVDDTARAKAQTLFTAIVNAFDSELQTETWLDVPTRIEALSKLHNMQGALIASQGLDTYDDVQVSATDVFADASARLNAHFFDRGLSQIGKKLPTLHVDFPSPQVNAAYDPSLNKINVPGGILGGYFFSPSAADLANFSGIGAVLGHEITHGFDNDGRNYDANGVERDWWTPGVATAFTGRAQCLIDEYSAYTCPGVPDPTTGQIPAHINGAQTLPENIADNGGVKLAYAASQVASMTGPVVSGFTPQQQFFIGYGQLWCAKMDPSVASGLLADDVHSPSRARVNLPLTNFDAFAAAFQCKAGTMSPANRCAVW